jgi:heme exporter protein B
VVSVNLGPLGIARAQGSAVLPVLLWLILLFSVAAGLPRAFIQEEESQTATALRLAATPSALFCGKLLYCLTLVGALEALVTPVYLTLMNLEVANPGLLVAALAAGGYGLAAWPWGARWSRRSLRRRGPKGLCFPCCPSRSFCRCCSWWSS